jgi:hypothetical protein
MGACDKNLTTKGKRLSKTVSEFLSTLGLVPGKLLRLRAKTFFVISPPCFETPDFGSEKAATSNIKERKSWQTTGTGNVAASGNVTSNPKTRYLKKNDIVMYLGVDMLYYGDEAYSCINVFCDEKIYCLYIISFEDLQESKNMILANWELLF